jgi:hypothetical protein
MRGGGWKKPVVEEECDGGMLIVWFVGLWMGE